MDTALATLLIQLAVTQGPQLVATLISLFQENKEAFTPEQIAALKGLVKPGDEYFMGGAGTK